MPRSSNFSSPKRAWIVAGLACAALFVLPERSAAAFSCSPLEWEGEYWRPGSFREPHEFPVDVEFWELRGCAFGLAVPSGCRLEREDEVIPVSIETFGSEQCDVDDSYVGDNYPDAIVHFVPERPLTPNRTYYFECDANGPSANDDQGQHTEVRSRLDPTPATRPGSLAEVGLEYVRGDDGCCSTGDRLELRFDFEAAWLQEGGYIEAVYDDGQVFATNGSGSFDGGPIWMPPTDGGLSLTPVAANGERGETLRFGEDDIDRQLVYMPCAVNGGAPPLAWWLFAPLVWIGVLGRRRRAAGGAS